MRIEEARCCLGMWICVVFYVSCAVLTT